MTNKPWIADGSELAEHEDHLIGNTEGLRILRDSIDKAINRGKAEIEGDGISAPWVGIKVLPNNPFAKETSGGKVRDKMLAVGCMTVVLIGLALVSLGLIKLGEIIK